MTRFQPVNLNDIPYLYHWQPFVADYLITLLRDRRLWCSKPSAFNDPWDCKPSYNTALLRHEDERDRHAKWYAEATRRRNPEIAPEVIRQTQRELRADPDLLTRRIVEVSEGMWSAIDQRYRVYCLGPDAHNSLMWAHYADSHKGLCLKFSTRNEVMCCALRVAYGQEYPTMHLYSDDPSENLVPLLTKSDVWGYEQEYRLVAQEGRFATGHDTLITNDNFLELPEDTLSAIIVGCQGPFEEVQKLVQKYAPEVHVRRAERIPNRYALRIC